MCVWIYVLFKLTYIMYIHVQYMYNACSTCRTIVQQLMSGSSIVERVLLHVCFLFIFFIFFIFYF